MSSDLTSLVCGLPKRGADLGQVLQHLGETLDAVVDQMQWICSQNDTSFGLFGPFLGRSILEIGLTAVASRFDPFRILAMRQMQMQPDFSIAKRRRSSVQWQGDILAEKPIQQLWSEDISAEKMPRALLGDYYEHLFWQKAFSEILDAVPDGEGGEWMEQLRVIDPDSFIPRMRTEAGRLYSSLSKGLHHEFVIPPAAVYDRSTVVTLLTDVLKVVSQVGLVSQMVPHCPYGLAINEAIVHFKDIQSIEVR